MVGVVAELVAEAADVDPQVVNLVEVLAAPDLGEQGPVLEHVTCVPHEVIQELVLRGRQVEPDTPEPRLVGAEVDFYIGEQARYDLWRQARAASSPRPSPA
jgi:hypothetical protein